MGKLECLRNKTIVSSPTRKRFEVRIVPKVMLPYPDRLVYDETVPSHSEPHEKPMDLLPLSSVQTPCLLDNETLHTQHTQQVPQVHPRALGNTIPVRVCPSH